jgi:hypothetical protein
MNIPNTWAPLVISAVKDALHYNQQLLKSETVRERADYEEHVVHLSQFFEYLKEEYKKVEEQAGIPLDRLL